MVIRSNVGLLNYRHGAREIPSTRGRNRWPLLADEDARRAACRGVRKGRQAVRVSYSIQTAGANEQRLPSKGGAFYRSASCYELNSSGKTLQNFGPT